MVALAASLVAVAIVATGCGDSSGEAGAAPAATASVDAAEAPLKLVSGTPKLNGAEQGTGDWVPRVDGRVAEKDRETAMKWVALRASRAGDLNPVVVDGAGRTLYRFDKDTTNPSRSNCTGKCEEVWPPVTVTEGSSVHFVGIKGKVGFLRRGSIQTPGGKQRKVYQVTLNGWALYEFSKDVEPGDAKGHGVDGVWFAIAPNGKKAKGKGAPPPPEPSPTAPSAPQPEEPAPPVEEDRSIKVIFYADFNFNDGGESFPLRDSGCVNLADKIEGISGIQVFKGTVRTWAQPDCKGELKVFTEDIGDLSEVGFDNVIKSARIVS
ncbi:hypothetical protein GCM10022251_75140 [Phytohabitans flavus]|uniref:Lipoprotein n=2 Tax=Phytohabitans flavus TaxID=1076124 RepID=A0A6F8XLF4_9ACTN|nr:hypothetical protein Pflav_010380 [Phytohabitans flavus]